METSQTVMPVAGRGPNGWPALRTAAAAALLVTVAVGTVSNLLFLGALQFRRDWFDDPALVVAGGARSAALLRWASITDLFSYYLPTAIVALALGLALRPHGPVLARASMLAGLGYVLAGAIGAATLATAGPMLLHEYEEPGADKAAIAIAFAVLIEVVFRAIWQLLNGLLLGVWWFGIARLTRADQPRFARLSAVLASLAWIGAGFNVVGFGFARDATLGVVFLLWAAWSIWLARLLWRRRPPFDSPDDFPQCRTPPSTELGSGPGDDGGHGVVTSASTSLVEPGRTRVRKSVTE